MTSKQRLDLIKRNTQEIVTESELKTLLKTKKTPSAYIGYATTGLLHMGHLVPLVKMADFLKAGFKFTFLSADLHAYLDDQKSTFNLLASRAKVYEELVKGALTSIGVPTTKIKFVKGSDYQLKKEYTLDVLKLQGVVRQRRALRAASEVVRLGDNPFVGGLSYPLMQIVDCKALRADAVLGGVDQRGIYMLGREVFDEIGYKKPVFVFTPLMASLSGDRMGGKMSASDNKSKISLLATEKEIRTGINTAFCPAKEQGPLLELLKFAVFPILENKKRAFKIQRPAKFGGDIIFKSYTELERAYLAGKLHPMDLKAALAGELNTILAPIRKQMAGKKALLKKAYPNLS